MPSPYEHLTTAEDLLRHARRLLGDGRHLEARSHAQVASAFLAAADARERIVPDPAPVPTARPEPLPDWCGSCDGPEPAQRWVQVTLPGEETARMARCPRCNPAALRCATPQPAARNAEAGDIGGV